MRRRDFVSAVANQRGQSLAQVLVVAAVGVIIALGLSSTIVQTQSAENSMKFRTDATTLADEARAFLETPGAADHTFAGLGPVNSGTSIDIPALKDSAGTIWYSVGSTYGDRTVIIESMKLDGFSSVGSTTAKMNLTISLAPAKKVSGMQTLIRQIPLSVNYDPLGVIVSTAVISDPSAATSQWKNGTVDPNEIYYGKYVGMGAPDPSTELHVSGSKNDVVGITLENQSPDLVADAEFVAVSNAGKAGFGINSVVYADPSMSNNAYIWTYSHANFILLGTNSTERMRVIETPTFDSFVGIGTTTPAYNLHVEGTAGLSTGTAWINASDIRLKDIHGDYEYGLDEVMKLHTVRFNYKKDNPLGLQSDKPMTGFIAQEVQKVIPDAVHENKNGFLELNVDPIHWAVVNAVQKIKRLVDRIDRRLARQERAMAFIESDADDLEQASADVTAYLCRKDPESEICR